jgi:hypothetical protein
VNLYLNEFHFPASELTQPPTLSDVYPPAPEPLPFQDYVLRLRFDTINISMVADYDMPQAVRMARDLRHQHLEALPEAADAFKQAGMSNQSTGLVYCFLSGMMCELRSRKPNKGTNMDRLVKIHDELSTMIQAPIIDIDDVDLFRVWQLTKETILVLNDIEKTWTVDQEFPLKAYKSTIEAYFFAHADANDVTCAEIMDFIFTLRSCYIQ